MLSKNNAKILFLLIFSIFFSGCGESHKISEEEEQEIITDLFSFQDCLDKNGIKIKDEAPGFFFEGEYYVQNANTMVKEDSLESTGFFLTKWISFSNLDENLCVVNYEDGEFYGNHTLAGQEVFRVKGKEDEKIVAIKADDNFYFTFAPYNEEHQYIIGYDLEEVLKHLVQGYIFNSKNAKVKNIKIEGEVEYSYINPITTIVLEVDNSDYFYYYSIFTYEDINVIADDYNERLYVFSADFE